LKKSEQPDHADKGDRGTCASGTRSSAFSLGSRAVRKKVLLVFKGHDSIWAGAVGGRGVDYARSIKNPRPVPWERENRPAQTPWFPGPKGGGVSYRRRPPLVWRGGAARPRPMVRSKEKRDLVMRDVGGTSHEKKTRGARKPCRGRGPFGQAARKRKGGQGQHLRTNCQSVTPGTTIDGRCGQGKTNNDEAWDDWFQQRKTECPVSASRGRKPSRKRGG